MDKVGKFSQLVVVVSILCVVEAYRDNDLTVEISAGRKECFYQPATLGQSLEIEYQVIDGGDLDIDFKVTAPNGNLVVADYRKNDGIQTIDPAQEGDYEICFDNSFSHITRKTVFFEIILDSSNDGDDLDDDDGEWKKFVSPDETYGDALTSMEVAGETMTTIKANNARTMQLQSFLRVFEAKDRNIVEHNFFRINVWSVTNIVVMLMVFGLQVFMVRNMFNEKKVRT